MNGHPRSIRVKDLVLFIVVVLLIGSILPRSFLRSFLPWLPKSPGQTDVKEIPIPADKLIGGIAPLSPGKAVELFVSVPDYFGTPVPQTLTDLKVLAVLDDKTVLMAVSTSSVPALQAALAADSAGFTYRLLPDTPVELPIPADRFIGGAGPLSPGQAVEIVASIPDDKGTPEPQTFAGLEVLALLGGEGEKGTKTVLMGIPPAIVPTLQPALLDEKMKFAYHLLPGTPTPTFTPTFTPVSTTTTPTPTLTPTPPDDKVYLEIDATKIDPYASTLVTGSAQLVIVQRLELPLIVVKRDSESAVTPAAVSTHTATTYTVTVIAFLDENGVHYPDYNKDETEHVLIQLLADQLADVARSLAGAESIWLVHIR